MLSSWNMEFCSDRGEESNDQKTSKVNICPSPQAKQKKKLGSILNIEKFERTNDDFHPQVPKNSEKSREFRQKQQVERKLCKSEELVKYMSSMPSYLERGGNPQEKPFNIGVLDWRLLEKWQNNNNGAASINRSHSQSTGNNASIISSKGSSYHRSDNTRSYHRQQTNHPSLPSNLNETVTEGCSSCTTQIAGNEQEFLDCKVKQSVKREKQSSSRDAMKRLADVKSQCPDLPKVTGMRSGAFEMDGVISGLDRNDMIHKGKASKAEKEVLSSAVTDCDFSERRKLAALESTNNPESRHSAVGHQSDSSKGDKNRSLGENQHTLYGGSGVNICDAKSRSDYTHSYSVAHGRGKAKDSRIEKSFSKEIRSLDCPSAGKEKPMPFSEYISISPSKRKNLEKKNSGSKTKNLAENELVFQMKVDTTKSSKVGNPSPTRRISFGIGRIGKSSYSNATANLVSENIPDSEVTSTCPNSSNNQKSNFTSKARSSPLRRLLDPLLKPKGHDVAGSSKRNPLKVDRTLKPSSEEPPALHSVKGKSGLNSCERDDIGGPDDRQKNGTSSMQALLQVTVKNGLPLFTFTVDNCSDILAATVKEISCEKTKRKWIYTFFSFSEMKKKNAHWINQGSKKDNNRGYISNIVGQMKASDILHESKSSRREFVFSSVGARDLDQTSDSSPGDELAAIIVKFPAGIGGQINHDGTQRGVSNEQSREPFPQVSNCSNLGNESANNGFLSTIVILPGGHHGVPSKGEPSPLIERWKSGGLCDCGGWDLGCRLRILASSSQSIQRFKSMKSQSTAFQLFSQEEVEVEEERPMFILSPFEDGIFSVEFDSSLKLVQAFLIGIAVLSTRTSAFLSSNMCGGKMFDEFTAAPEVSKIFNQVAPGEICANYISNPPLSPVGRV